MSQPETSLTPLGHQILTHWQRHRPRAVARLSLQGQLSAAILQAQEATTALLYRLEVEQGMGHLEAWEIATREHAFLPDEPASISESDRPQHW